MWAEIEKREPDHGPLSEEELKQISSEDDYISGEEARREYGLLVDLP